MNKKVKVWLGKGMVMLNINLKHLKRFEHTFSIELIVYIPKSNAYITEHSKRRLLIIYFLPSRL